MKSESGCIMVVDDDDAMQSLLRDYFVGAGFTVLAFATAADALARLPSSQIDVVISDVRMPGIGGFEFVEKVAAVCPGLPVILITAFGSIDSAIEAIRRGAHDYLVKPFKLAEIRVKVDRAREFVKLHRAHRALREDVERPWSLDHMLGKSLVMQKLFALVTRVAHASANVLITGESGTGKEMVARAIHNLGDRRDQAFIAVDCTAIPETLLESELFGHAKGSFTGAVQRKRGLFEDADGGTIFLDEIGDMDINLQAKLLRVLQQRAIRAVGQNAYRDVDVRIVAATNKDLRTAVRLGHFREDLFFRLSVIPIEIPPLRDRRDDIPLLVEAFLKKYGAANGRRVRAISPAAMRRLVEASWQGNVRELENVVERSVVLAEGPVIDAKDLPELDGPSAETILEAAVNDLPTLAELEARYIRFVLAKTGGHKERTAQILGINRRTLYRKQHDQDVTDERGDGLHDLDGGDVDADGRLDEPTAPTRLARLRGAKD